MSKANKTEEQVISETEGLRQMIDDFRSQDSSYKKLNDQLQAEIDVGGYCKNLAEALLIHK